MKQTQKLTITIVCITSLTAALADPQLPDLYAQAKEAYKNGDCNLSVKLFNKYKTENEGKLKEHAEFSQQIDDAINDCQKKLMSGNYDRGVTAKNIDSVVAKIQVAIEEINKGVSAAEASALIKQANNASKEFNANDKVDMVRTKANNKLKRAFAHANKSDLKEANQELRDARKIFEDMKSML
jgi:hypothetical protein